MNLTPPSIPSDITPEQVGSLKEKVRRENLEWRYKVLRACRRDQGLRELVKEKFYRDWQFAINGFLWTYERVHGFENKFRHSPYILWPVQVEHISTLVRSIEEGFDVLTDKSRDMGATWDHIVIYVWHWLKPEPGNDFLLGSRKEDYVDFKQSMGTLFGKARYAIRRLPAFLLPRGFKWRVHSSRLYLENPESGSTITGESCNADFGSGDRRRAVLLDEFAKWERGIDKQAWTAVGDVTRARHALSTPKGVGNQFEQLRFGGQIVHFEMGWWLHPEKAQGLYVEEVPIYDERGNISSYKKKLRSPWYDEQCHRRTPFEVRQEIDIDYVTTGAPAFDRDLIKRRMDALRADPLTPEFVGSIILVQDKSLEDEVITQEPKLLPSEFGPLTIWEQPKEWDFYVISVDPSGGLEDGDFNSITVTNRRSLDVVAEFHGLFKEHELATASVALAIYYNGGWLVIEANSMGAAVIQYAVEVLRYRKVYRRRQTDTVTKKWTLSWGWKTTTNTWGLVRAAINRFLDQERGRIPSLALLEELYYTEVKPSGKLMGATGHNDDRMASFGVGLAAHAQLPYEWKALDDLKTEDELEYEELERKRMEGKSDSVIFMEDYRNRLLEQVSKTPTFGMKYDRGNSPI